MIFTDCTFCRGHGKLYRRVGPFEWDDRHTLQCHACKGAGMVPMKCYQCNENATHGIDRTNPYLCDECIKEAPRFAKREQDKIKEFIDTQGRFQ